MLFPKLLIALLPLASALPTPAPAKRAPEIWELDPLVQRLVNLDPTFYTRYVLTGEIDGIAGLPGVRPDHHGSAEHFPEVVRSKGEYESWIAKRGHPHAVAHHGAGLGERLLGLFGPPVTAKSSSAAKPSSSSAAKSSAAAQASTKGPAAPPVVASSTAAKPSSSSAKASSAAAPASATPKVAAPNPSAAGTSSTATPSSASAPLPLWNPATGGTSYLDVKQTRLGDCWLASTMMALSWVNPKWIPALFTNPGNNPVTSSTSFTGFFQPTSSVAVTLDKIAASANAGKYGATNMATAWWPAAIEYATSTYWGSLGWTDLLYGSGQPSYALQWLTNYAVGTVQGGMTQKPAHSIQPQLTAQVLNNMQWAAYSPVLISTKPSTTVLPGRHALAILWASSGATQVALQNPWYNYVQLYNLSTIVNDIQSIQWLVGHQNGPGGSVQSSTWSGNTNGKPLPQVVVS